MGRAPFSDEMAVRQVGCDIYVIPIGKTVVNVPCSHRPPVVIEIHDPVFSATESCRTFGTSATRPLWKLAQIASIVEVLFSDGERFEIEILFDTRSCFGGIPAMVRTNKYGAPNVFMSSGDVFLQRKRLDRDSRLPAEFPDQSGHRVRSGPVSIHSEPLVRRMISLVRLRIWNNK